MFLKKGEDLPNPTILSHNYIGTKSSSELFKFEIEESTPVPVEAILCYRSSQYISLDFIGFEIPNKWAGYTINSFSEIIRYYKYTINQF